MANNKNKNKNKNAAAAAQATVKTTQVETKETKAPEAKVETKQEEKPKAQSQTTTKTPDKKPDKTPKKEEPKEKAPDPKVEETSVEEVAHKDKEKELQEVFLGKSTVAEVATLLQDNANYQFDANHAATFLDVLERRTAKMKDSSLKIKMEETLDYNLAFYAIVLSVQTYNAKKTLNLVVPSDEAIVQNFMDTFAGLGVALAPHKDDNNPQQTILEFKEISPETRAAAEEEIKQQVEKKNPEIPHKHHEWTEEELDPKNWDNDDIAKAALAEEFRRTGETPSNKLLRLLGKVREYKITHVDADKKAEWESASLGTLMEELNRIASNKFTVITRGLGSAVVNQMRTDGTVLFAHANMKKNMPALSDQDVCDLNKTFIRILHTGDKPVEEDMAVTNGILSLDRDKIFRIATESPTGDDDVAQFKKIFGAFYKAFVNETGSKKVINDDGQEVANPDYSSLKVANKMIEIRNLYVDKDSAFKPFKEGEYPQSK